MRLALLGNAIVLYAVSACGPGCAARVSPHRRPHPVEEVVRAENVRAARNASKPLAPKPVAQVVNFENTPQDQTWTVTGWGKTQADAEQVALDNACKEVNNSLGRQDVHWRPSADFVDHNLVKGRKTGLENVPPGLEDLP